jgi:hypothetical protein
VKLAADLDQNLRHLHRLLVLPGPVLGLPGGGEPGDRPATACLPCNDDGRSWDYGLGLAAHDFHVAARVSDQPGPLLDDVDALARVASPANSLAALAVMMPVWEERDSTYLALECAGRLPAPSRLRWCAEDDHRADLRSALACERRYWEPVYAAWAADSGPMAYDRAIAEDRGRQDLWESCTAWWAMARTVNHDRATFQAADAWLAGGPLRELHGGDNGPYSLLSTPDLGLDDALARILGNATHHRLAVLAVQLIESFRRDGALPADGGALDLAGDGYRLPLTYDRINPHRFRIHVATTATWPYYDHFEDGAPTVPDDARVLQVGLSDTWVLVDMVPHTRYRGRYRGD